MSEREKIRFKRWRLYVILLMLLLVIIALIARVAYLSSVENTFLDKQGNARSLRIVQVPAYRGMLLDRSGNPMAVSTPVSSVWLNPKQFVDNEKNKLALTTALGLPISNLTDLLQKNQDKQFVYLKRDVSPPVAASVKTLALKGVYFEKSYRRYYPDGAAAAHVIGFTNVDNKGIAGLELLYNKQLQGTPGKKLVEQDRYGHTIAVLGQLKPARPGKNIKISIDQRIQFLAYRVLQNALKKFKAESGSAVVLSVKTGQILAMTNLPSYNPNDKAKTPAANFRNRAVTDVYEPGSVMKTFAIVNALRSGKFTPGMKINTHPGYLYLNGHEVDDENVDHGVLTVTQVLQKSSNVGITKMMLKLPPDSLWHVLHDFGFGHKTGCDFPGEQAGSLVNHRRWAPIVIATLSFGYGVTVTPLQLARAYAAIANHGRLLPLTFQIGQAAPAGVQAIPADIADKTIPLLEAVVSRQGTGYLARVPGYHIAGKTGTARIAKPGGYSHQHVATFVNIAPASNPQLVVLVVIHKPHGTRYYASYLAAPATQKIMAGALELLNIPPDDMQSYQQDEQKQKRHWVAPV